MARYTESEKQFLIENYPKFGGPYCAIHLNRSESSMNAQASRLKIARVGKTKHPTLQNVNSEEFISVKTPEVAYMLGFIWADGYIVGSGVRRTIEIEITEKDAEVLAPIFNKVGKWAIRKRQRGNDKPTWTFSTNNKNIYDFLFANDYKEKSLVSCCKILQIIPNDFKKYFWRGYFDGDGTVKCIGRGIAIGLAGSYNQDWSEIEKLYQSLGQTNYKIYKREQNGNKSSSVIVQNRLGCFLISSYLLSSSLGLARKTERLKLLNEKTTPR